MYKGYKFRFSSDTCLAAPRASLQMATSQKKKTQHGIPNGKVEEWMACCCCYKAFASDR